MEPIEGSETSAFKPQTPGKYPKENILHKEHGESLKSRQQVRILYAVLHYTLFVWAYSSSQYAVRDVKNILVTNILHS